jgi:hypothetical protein
LLIIFYAWLVHGGIFFSPVRCTSEVLLGLLLAQFMHGVSGLG